MLNSGELVVEMQTSQSERYDVTFCLLVPSYEKKKKALMNVNARLREFYPDSEELFDIVLMTNNHAQVGVRLINSINHYGTLQTSARSPP